MMQGDERPEAVLVAGPTASGKSAFAMELAERTGGTVVNADSMQLYDTLRVVTARPSEGDEARVPHALYGVVPVREPMSAALYVERVRTLLPTLRTEGTLPIFVGGTGLYLRALEQGLSPVPTIAPQVRDAVRVMDTHGLHAALADEDAVMAGKLRPTDTQRMARALEVVRSTGRSLADWHEEAEAGPLAGLRVRRYLLAIDRPVLHSLIEARSRSIVADPAAAAEVEALERFDPSGTSLVSRAIGVKEVRALVRGEWTQAFAAKKLTVATRRYAKRQGTWFRNALDETWEVVPAGISADGFSTAL